jgi:hypothetical protein
MEHHRGEYAPAGQQWDGPTKVEEAEINNYDMLSGSHLFLP